MYTVAHIVGWLMWLSYIIIFHRRLRPAARARRISSVSVCLMQTVSVCHTPAAESFMIVVYLTRCHAQHSQHESIHNSIRPDTTRRLHSVAVTRQEVIRILNTEDCPRLSCSSSSSRSRIVMLFIQSAWHFDVLRPRCVVALKPNFSWPCMDMLC